MAFQPIATALLLHAPRFDRTPDSSRFTLLIRPRTGTVWLDVI
jgi:hypothetical protein